MLLLGSYEINRTVTSLVLLFPIIGTIPGLCVQTDIFFKDFIGQEVLGCAALNKQRAAGQKTSKPASWIVLMIALSASHPPRAGVSVQTGRIWRACTQEHVTSYTVLKLSDAAECFLQVSYHYAVVVDYYRFIERGHSAK